MSLKPNEKPSDDAMKILDELESLPEQARFAELSIQVSRKVKFEGLIDILKLYQSKCSNSSDQFEVTKISVKSMTEGGDTKLFSFNFSNDRSKVEFVGLAVRMEVKDIVDFVICTYTYKEPTKSVTVEDSITQLIGRKFLWMNLEPNKVVTKTSRVVQESVAIKDTALPYLEAAFLFELKRRGLLVMDSKTKQLALTI